MAAGERWASRCLMLALSLAFCLSFWSAATAQAEPTPYSPPEGSFTEPVPGGLPGCAEAPGPLEAEPEAVVAELHRLRSESVAACEATTARLDLVWHRLWWVTVEAAESAPQRSLANEKLTALVEALGAPREVTLAGTSTESPLPVHDASAASAAVGTEGVAEAVNASGEAMTGVGWFLAGLLVACFLGYVIYRQVMPRA
jgi:hypothetical protein